ncbi:FHA domain-containing protein [Kallotenue papyrolyticum]|uniref:FHA domain-containing protein n=1 Tax=Kallotenue papyrolyticum TaxID=1325125 RepID=UPI00047855A5|nr:FHA domain-containing protein [Kallotenue papyrolyticum]
MIDRAALERERETYLREIAALETQIRSLRDYIAAQERHLRTAADSVRDITERGLAEARSELQLKELRLQQLRQDLQRVQHVLGKLAEVERKQRDITVLEREQARIGEMLERARLDLARLMDEVRLLEGTPAAPAPPTRLIRTYALEFAAGQRVPLPAATSDLLVGCRDANVAPDVDLTPFGGTTSGVSRRHAVLRFVNDSWTISDLNSTNGTFVDGVRIAPHTQVPLRIGARLRFGAVEATLLEV